MIIEPSKQYPPEKVRHAADAATVQPLQSAGIPPGQADPTFMIWGTDAEEVPAPPSYDDTVASPSQSTFSFNERWEGSSTSSSYAGPSRPPSIAASSMAMRGGAAFSGAPLERNGTVISSASSSSSLASSPHRAQFSPQFDAYGNIVNTAFASAAYAPPLTPAQDLSDRASIAGTVMSSATTAGSGTLRHFAPSAALANFLNRSAPPPPFLRTPRPGMSYEPFRPTALVSRSSTLEKGFPDQPPMTLAHPHPFGTHDISEQDWKRFLVDLKAVANAYPMNKLLAAAGPAARGLNMPLGVLSPVSFVVNLGLDAHVKSRKKGPVGEFIDHWNQHFFHLRRMQVSLCQGKYVYSGPETIPADMASPDPSGLVQMYQDDTDSEEEGTSTALNKAANMTESALRDAREARRRWKEDQRQRRMDRRQQGMKAPKWRLVISPKQYVLFE